MKFLISALLTTIIVLGLVELSSQLSAAEYRANRECKSRKLEKGQTNRDEQCSEFYENNVNFFLSLFVFISWGALVRTVLRLLNVSVPYTVALMITGLFLGAFTRISSICGVWSSYTKIARMPPKIILYIFLPALVFESAFNMKVHIFMRSAYQILVVALPGMLISTTITAFVCKAFMSKYNWSFTVSMLYGSIISATDPVAVVSILRELGTSETLGMMIEGESLLNDGVAILLYEIFEELAVEDVDNIALEVTVKVLKIALGGPALGFTMGKLAVVWLALIFNDAATEITITIVAAYLTYWLGEFLGCSGVVSCVILGLKMSADSTSISPEVEKLVHHFWEMIGYLANTVLFVIVGIIVTETALSKIDAYDWIYLAFLYFILNIIRLTMLMMLMPWLTRIGYGLQWKDMLVMMWGGLRGAVGLCLSLEVYYSKQFCDLGNDSVGPKFLFHTAGIVFFTLAINGTTTKWLLDKLGLTAVSPGRLQDMTNAVKQIVGAQLRTLAMLKHDRFLADASWDLVEHYTEIHDPYHMQKVKAEKVSRKPTVLTLRIDEEAFHGDPADEFSDPTRAHENDPTPVEYKVMTEEARQRLLKALKVSFWRQYEQGVLTDTAVQVLIGVAETTSDKELHMIHARDFQKYWEVHGFYHWVRVKVIKKLGLDVAPELPPRPLSKFRRPFWWLTTRDWFDGVIHVLVILNLIPVIWEVVATYKHRRANSGADLPYEQALSFFITGCVFTIIYTVEFIMKLTGHGCKYYWTTKWNYIDITVLVTSYADIAVSYAYGFGPAGPKQRTQTYMKTLRYVVTAFRLARLSRSLRLFRPLLPRLNAFIDNKVNLTLFLGYDIGKGLVTAVDDVLKFLPQMVEHPRVLAKLKTALDNERLETIRGLGLLQKAHPRIAIGVKTRHASRAVLNQMRETLNELKEDGLVDETEFAALMDILEHKMKRLWSTPASIVPSSPEALLSNVVWVLSNAELTSFVYNHATLLNFGEGDTICTHGDPPNGIYVIVSGMIKLHYVPTIEAVEKQLTQGLIPNLELYTDVSFKSEETDYLSTGTVLGELGILTDQVCATLVTCETAVVAYHISQNSMKEAMALFMDKNDSLESRLWRSVGMKLAAALLPTQAAYQSWTLDKIRMHLERSAAPVGPQFENLTIPEFVSDVIVIHGQVVDAQTRHVYTAPCLLPHSCTKIAQLEGSTVLARILIVANEEIDHEGSETSLNASSVTSLLDHPHTSDEKVASKNRRKSAAVNFGVQKSGEIDTSNP